MKTDFTTILSRLQSNCPFLKELDLSDQHITQSQIKNLIHSLIKNKHLTILNLKGNNIGDDGAILISQMLFYNTTLLEINLQNNNIKEIGRRALGRAIKMYRPLKISLIRNFILLGSVDNTVYHIMMLRENKYIFGEKRSVSKII